MGQPSKTSGFALAPPGSEAPHRRRRAETKEHHSKNTSGTKNQVMYKLTSDTMDGVCASVREAHIQGDNEQVHQKDGVCRERSATDVPSITKSCGYAVSNARNGTDLTELCKA